MLGPFGSLGLEFRAKGLQCQGAAGIVQVWIRLLSFIIFGRYHHFLFAGAPQGFVLVLVDSSPTST